MRVTVAVPTTGVESRLGPWTESIIKSTKFPPAVTVHIIQNPWVVDRDTTRWVMMLERKGFKVRVSKYRRRIGLAAAWDHACVTTESNYLCIVNDDIEFVENWDEKLQDLLERTSQHILLACEPYNWSGFIVDSHWYQTYGWTLFPEKYISGYWEDNEIYLSMAHAHDLRTKHDIYTQLIYCMPYNEKGAHLFKHKPREGGGKWEEGPNKLVFDSRWAKSSPECPEAIELKNGHWYRPRQL